MPAEVKTSVEKLLEQRFNGKVRLGAAVDIRSSDLRLMPNNCGSGSLGLDWGYDVKKMVRAGSNAANQSLCVRLNAIHLPSGASRRAHVFAYYSNNTAMR